MNIITLWYCVAGGYIQTIDAQNAALLNSVNSVVIVPNINSVVSLNMYLSPGSL